MTSVSVPMDCLSFQAVDTKARSYFKFARPNLWLVSALFLALTVQLVVRISIVQQGYRLENLRQAAVESDSTLRALSYEYASITGAPVINRRAKEELQLMPIGPKRLRRLNRNLF